MKSEGHWLPRDTGRSHPSQDRRGDSLPRRGFALRLLSSPPAFSFLKLLPLWFFQSQKQKVWHHQQPPRALSPSFRLASVPLTFICVTANSVLHSNWSLKMKNKGSLRPRDTDLAKRVEKVAGRRKDVSQKSFSEGEEDSGG